VSCEIQRVQDRGQYVAVARLPIRLRLRIDAVVLAFDCLHGQLHVQVQTR
jgi:hypothetical protein